MFSTNTHLSSDVPPPLIDLDSSSDDGPPPLAGGATSTTGPPARHRRVVKIPSDYTLHYYLELPHGPVPAPEGELVGGPEAVVRAQRHGDDLALQIRRF